MNEVLERLKTAASKLGPDQCEDAFALAAVECSGCCKISNSGNGSCPPKPMEEEY